MKKIFIVISACFIITLLGCQEKGQPVPYCYSFSIIDSTGINIVGDTINRKRYYADSIKFYTLDGTLRTKYPYINGGVNGYNIGACTKTKSCTLTNLSDKFLIKYNNSISENDTVDVVYGKRNVNIYRNSVLIFNKEDISQTTEIHFNIIK